MGQWDTERGPRMGGVQSRARVRFSACLSASPWLLSISRMAVEFSEWTDLNTNPREVNGGFSTPTPSQSPSVRGQHQPGRQHGSAPRRLGTRARTLQTVAVTSTGPGQP